jgi:hypothetical protein
MHEAIVAVWARYSLDSMNLVTANHVRSSTGGNVKHTLALGWVMACLPALAAAGCAGGTVAPITAPAGFSLNYQGAGTVAVAVRDQREDVLNGEREETMVGHQRSLYGIPYPVSNSSGKPFANDFADLIVRGISARGIPAQAVRVSPFKSEDEAVASLVATGSDRNLLFNVVEWDADTLSQTTLHYDIRLSVYDRQGKQLRETSLAGEDDLGAGRPERASVPAATADILQALVGAKAIVGALQPVSIPTKSCTVEQILKMQESGLTKQQIEAACGAGSSR